ncbi:ribosomal-protein-alanine N-acetyltransferase [Paraburkholderia terricola]|uniref:GNAT family N-acetyltransferase n=1 Tax=Paraburkholderia terricola TaxID=169427 RepID=UPI002860840E|nr:GNAT family N-acetyltransferase [Paraburkholderia terricola]MDR6490637.1 ribosomal-protein-alanine N-acetyltransferase [Paraburkholderia terricola]
MAEISSNALKDGLTSARLKLVRAEAAFAPALHDYSLRNREHLQPWEPARPDSFFELEAIKNRLGAMSRDNALGHAVHWLLTRRDSAEVIGECHFTNIVRGPFQACHLGFSLAKHAQGQGLMQEALTVAIPHVFNDVGLHRIMANYRPENIRSGQLLKRLGFEREGLARAYLKINGAWADHVLTSLINPSATS